MSQQFTQQSYKWLQNTVQDCTTCYRMKSPTAQATVLRTLETPTPRTAQGGCHHSGDRTQWPPTAPPWCFDSSGLIWGWHVILRHWVASWEHCRRGQAHHTTGKINARSWEVCCLLNTVLERLRLLKLLHFPAYPCGHQWHFQSNYWANQEHCGQWWRGPGGVSQALQKEEKGWGHSRCAQRVNIWLLVEFSLLWPRNLFQKQGFTWPSVARVSLPPSSLNLWIRLQTRHGGKKLSHLREYKGNTWQGRLSHFACESDVWGLTSSPCTPVHTAWKATAGLTPCTVTEL